MNKGQLDRKKFAKEIPNSRILEGTSDLLQLSP